MVTVVNPGNLPLDIATFIGREDELQQACDLLLCDARLLTLTGPGGVGKTRLAVRIASELQAECDDGAWMVDLGALPASCRPERLYADIARAMGIHHQALDKDVLLQHLRTKQALLLLDNCEHVVDTTRACVTAMLRAVPDLRILATSRQPLAVEGEHNLKVPPLESDVAVAVFQAHARQILGAEVAARLDRKMVATLCAQLDGLPLAIGLAVGRLRTLSVDDVLERLSDRFGLLAETSLPDSDPVGRHSIEKVMEWSFDLCTPDEQQLWKLSAVFAGSFDLTALEAVCGRAGLDAASILDVLTGLVKKSVIEVDYGTHGPRRYHLLETLREYGRRRLDEAGDAPLVRSAHRDYYRDLVASAATTWLGPTELEAMRIVHHELLQILAAIVECVERGDLPTAAAMCCNIVRCRAPFFWGYLDLIRQQLTHIIDAWDTTKIQSDEEAAGLASTMATAAWVMVTQGRQTDAQALLDAVDALLSHRDIPAPPPVLFAKGGSLVLGHGSNQALPLLDRASQAFVAGGFAGDAHMADLLKAIGWVFTGDSPRAVAICAEFLDQAIAAQAPWAVSWALWPNALAALQQDHLPAAAEYIVRSLRLQRGMGDQWGSTWGLEVCAWIIAAGLHTADDPRREAERAARLLGAASTQQRNLGVNLPGMPPLARGRARALEQIAAVLDDNAIDAAVRRGADHHQSAWDIALPRDRDRPRRAAGTTHGDTAEDNLTRREKEIAPLLAQGWSNKRIALELTVTERTVETHVGNILRKLGVPNRASIAAKLGKPPAEDPDANA